MTKTEVIVVNLSTSGSRLGGASIAAELHSKFMSQSYPLELWRMWDNDLEAQLDSLKIRNFATEDKLKFMRNFLPKQARAIFYDSKILEEILSLHPRIIHLQNPLPALAFYKIAQRASENGIKVVASTHGFFEVLNPSYKFNFFQTLIWHHFIKKPMIKSLQYVDAILSGYPSEKNTLLTLGIPESKIHLVPNGVNPFFLALPSEKEMQNVLQKYKINANKPILLFIGNHTPNKGLSTVIKTAELFTKPATFVIGGKLTNADEPSYWMEQIRLKDNIELIFTDYLSLIDQRALYHLASILLFPSLSDTLPLTIIEAMACELPVIAYGVGGIPFELNNESGIVIKPGDFESFLNAVESLLSNQFRRIEIMKNAKFRQQNHFTWEIAAKKTLDVYQRLFD